MNSSKINQLITEEENQISLEMFGKPYAELEFGEAQLVAEYMDDLANPEWKQVIYDGYLTSYDVSNTGEVRNRLTGKILRQKINRDGYKMFNLCYGGRKHTTTIHKLVGTAFLKRESPDLIINHKNGNKSFNWYRNLEWVSQQENVQHAIQTGLAGRNGIDNPNNTYPLETIHQVCKMLEAGMNGTAISKALGVKKSLAENIKRGKLWQDIASGYNIPKPVSVKRSDELKKQITALIDAGYSNREIVQATGLPDTEHEREYVGLFRRRLLKKRLLERSETIDQL